MDIKMEGMNGIEVTRKILSELPDTHIIMLTMVEDSDSLFVAMTAGAKGYVLKGARRDDVLRTIRAVSHGEVLFSSGIANRLTDFFRNLDAPANHEPIKSDFPELTKRENEILVLMAQQMSNTDIALRLGITGKTVSNHISNIFNKLQVADRTQAIHKAHESGLSSQNANTDID
jgi:DNA-binding NarL/FixJ family response regulator